MDSGQEQQGYVLPRAAGEFLTPGAVAKMIGVTPKTVSNWCDRGIVDCMTMPSKHRRIPASEVERLKAMLR